MVTGRRVDLLVRLRPLNLWPLRSPG